MKETEAIDRMRQVIRRQHKALATEEAYVLWLRRYMRALRQMPLQLSSEKKLEKFLTDLALKRDLSARVTECMRPTSNVLSSMPHESSASPSFHMS